MSSEKASLEPRHTSGNIQSAGHEVLARHTATQGPMQSAEESRELRDASCSEPANVGLAELGALIVMNPFASGQGRSHGLFLVHDVFVLSIRVWCGCAPGKKACRPTSPFARSACRFCPKCMDGARASVDIKLQKNFLPRAL